MALTASSAVYPRPTENETLFRTARRQGQIGVKKECAVTPGAVRNASLTSSSRPLAIEPFREVSTA